MEVFELTTEQEKAFNAMKRAVAKCKKLKIGFFDVLGTTYAYDKGKIERFDVDANYELDCGKYGYPPNSLSVGGCSYADDQIIHSMLLTNNGRKIFENDKEYL